MLAERWSDEPVEQHEAGTGNRDALTEVLTKIKATGKRGRASAVSGRTGCPG